MVFGTDESRGLMRLTIDKWHLWQRQTIMSVAGMEIVEPGVGGFSVVFKQYWSQIARVQSRKRNHVEKRCRRASTYWVRFSHACGRVIAALVIISEAIVSLHSTKITMFMSLIDETKHSSFTGEKLNGKRQQQSQLEVQVTFFWKANAGMSSLLRNHTLGCHQIRLW